MILKFMNYSEWYWKHFAKVFQTIEYQIKYKKKEMNKRKHCQEKNI